MIKGSGFIEFKDSDSWEYNKGYLIYIPADIEHQIIASEKADNGFFFYSIARGIVFRQNLIQ